MRSVCDHSGREENGWAQSEKREKWPCLEGRTNLGSEVGQEGRRKVQASPWFWPEHQRKGVATLGRTSSSGLNDREEADSWMHECEVQGGG